MLEAFNLRNAYRFGWLKKRSLPVIESISINFGKGETVGIVGKSGSGKSTLALLLAGLFCQRIYRLKDGKLEHYPG